jgi:hypothetical protein
MLIISLAKQELLLLSKRNIEVPEVMCMRMHDLFFQFLNGTVNQQQTRAQNTVSVKLKRHN